MQRHKQNLLDLKQRFGSKLRLRISFDHYTPARHEEERGLGSFKPALEGMIWLSENGFDISVCGRTMWGESIDDERKGYRTFFAEHDIRVDAADPGALVLFPEMDADIDVPEITTACWDILAKSPDDMMCATSRMIVKRKGDDRPVVLPCTLLPYDEEFELGKTLSDAEKSVPLNHPHCAKFCVLGGASCTGA